MTSSGDGPLKDRVPFWTLVVSVGILVFTAAGTLAVLGVFKGSSESTTGTQTSPPTVPTVHTTPPPTGAAFLDELTPSGGDTPTGAEAKLGGREFRHSVVYEKMGDGESVASSCKNEPFACRATSYDLHEGHRTFTATFGLTESGTEAGVGSPEASWKVVVDGRVEKSGKVKPNVGVPLTISVAGRRVLELRVTLEGNYPAGVVSAIWGEARVS